MVPKKIGTIVVKNDQRVLVPVRVQNGWKMFIDFRKLNNVTNKDYFPIPFIDQMLERLNGKLFFYFLNGCSGFYQILVCQEVREKATFTCPFETFTYLIQAHSKGVCRVSSQSSSRLF